MKNKTQTYYLFFSILIIGVSLFVIENYLIPKTSNYSYYNNSDYTIKILTKYPHPSELISALNNGSMSCSDLNTELRVLVNIVKENECKNA